MVTRVTGCSSTALLPDPDGVRYTVTRTVPMPWRPTGIVAAGVAPRVCDVAALVELLFGERWAVN